MSAVSEKSDPSKIQLFVKQESSHLPLIISSVAFIAIALAVLATVYFHHDIGKAHQLFMTGQEALLYVTLPIIGGGLLIGGIVLAVRISQRNKAANAIFEKTIISAKTVSLRDTLAAMRFPKHLKRMAITAGVLALIAVGIFCFFHFFPQLANQYLIQPVLAHSFELWQVIAYFAIPAAVIPLIIGCGAWMAQASLDQKRIRAQLSLAGSRVIT